MRIPPPAYVRSSRGARRVFFGVHRGGLSMRGRAGRRGKQDVSEFGARLDSADLFFFGALLVRFFRRLPVSGNAPRRGGRLVCAAGSVCSGAPVTGALSRCIPVNKLTGARSFCCRTSAGLHGIAYDWRFVRSPSQRRCRRNLNLRAAKRFIADAEWRSEGRAHTQHRDVVVRRFCTGVSADGRGGAMTQETRIERTPRQGEASNRRAS